MKRIVTGRLKHRKIVHRVDIISYEHLDKECVTTCGHFFLISHTELRKNRPLEEVTCRKCQRTL